MVGHYKPYHEHVLLNARPQHTYQIRDTVLLLIQNQVLRLLKEKSFTLSWVVIKKLLMKIIC